MGSSYRHDRASAPRRALTKRLLQVAIVLYVVLYSIFYRTTHLRIEPVAGDVRIDGWLDRSRSQPQALAALGYCSYRVDDAPAGACIMALRDTPVVGGFGTDRLAVGERVAVLGTPPEEVDGYMMISIFPAGRVYVQDMVLCDQPASGLAQRRRCGYVNDVDLHSFQEGNFIPTYVQLIHQKATCADGTHDLAACQLDYPTNTAYQQQIDEFFIGAVEKHEVQIVHTFQSESLGQLRMDQAVGLGVPDCGGGVEEVPFCRDPLAGGHDMSSVEHLLSLVGETLSSNNAATDHSSHRETFRTSGMKLHIQVHYSNLEGFWSWTGTGPVVYKYLVKQVPSETVWRSRTIARREEMRTWVSGERLAKFAEHDRMLIWAVGIELQARVSGQVGHLDPSSLLLTLASAAPLLFFSSALVNCMFAAAGTDVEDEDYAAGATGMLSTGACSPGLSGGDDAL